MSKAVKATRRTLNLALKKRILDASISKGPKELGNQFRLPTSTISTILQQKRKILEAINEGSQSKRAHLKASKHGNLEEALIVWLKQVRSKNECVDGNLLKEKALECFKNVKKLPVLYEAKTKAWMTVEIFERYLKQWNWKLAMSNRKILLLIDNCPAHSQIALSHIRLQFFLPNATAAIQPMDMGIIQNLKVKYRVFLLKQRIAAIDQKFSFEFDLLDAIQLFEQAWIEVKAETLLNCFKKAGFVLEDDVSRVIDNDDDITKSLDSIWNQLVDRGDVDRTISAADYLFADNSVVTTGVRTLEEIATAYGSEILISSESENEEEIRND